LEEEMNQSLARRDLLAGLACSLILLPGCSTLGALNFEGAIRRHTVPAHLIGHVMREGHDRGRLLQRAKAR
jgi:hypothetical protein